MKALVKVDAGPGLALIDMADPGCGPNEVVVRVLRAGICGTDLHIDAWDDWAARTITAPLVIGHEFAGEVVEIGSGVTSVKVGDLVSGEGHLVCGTCRNCKAGRRHLCANTLGLGVHRNGAFAQYTVLPEANVWVHRNPIDVDIAAIFDPFGNAVHTALSFPVIGEDVLVTGAGPIGIMAAAIAKHAGARNIVITDISESRLDIARKIGVDLALNVTEHSIAEAQEKLNMVEGFDVGMEMSGQPKALQEMLANMAHGGRIALLGLPPTEFAVDWSSVVLKMLHIKGIYGREMFESWYAMSVLLQRGLDLRPIITHRFDYTDYLEAFDTARSGTSGKVLLDWAGAA